MMQDPLIIKNDDPSGSNWTDKERKEVKELIKTCIKNRNGLLLSDFREEYKKCTDEDVPYIRVGYKSLFHLVNDIPEISTVQNEDGVYVLVVSDSNKAEHIQRMEEKQEDHEDNKPQYDFKLSFECNDGQFSYVFGNKKINFVNQEGKMSMIETDNSENLEPKYNDESIDKDKNKKRPPCYENQKRVIDADERFFYNKIKCTEPVVGSHQLIGDDFFLQICMNYLSVPVERWQYCTRGVISTVCGTVESGLSIKQSIERLSLIEELGNKVVINLGAVDINEKRSCAEMIENYITLLYLLISKFGIPEKNIVLCTIPPLADLEEDIYIEQSSRIFMFNFWLRDFAKKQGHKLIDLYAEFTTGVYGVIKDEFYETDKDLVSDKTLWNYNGRQRVMEILLNL